MLIDVPRGTRVRGMRFGASLCMALEAGWKTETRRVIVRGNSRLNRGEFAQLDLSSGRPDRLRPVSSLRCRINTPTKERRSVIVAPLIRPGSMIWPRVGQEGPRARRENASIMLKVLEVSCGRLCDLSEDSAWAEGVAIFASSAPRLSSDAIDPLGMRRQWAAEAYEFLLGQQGKKHHAQWMRGQVHQEIVGRGPTGRDCFALLWEWLSGPGSWQANPWVWCYKLEPA